MRNQCFLILLSLMFVSQGLPAQLLLDDIDHITARSTCSDAVLTDDFTQGQENASLSGVCRSADKIFVCPGEYVQFGLRHQGNVGNFPGFDMPCDTYPRLDANYMWTASWGATFEWNPVEEYSDEVIAQVEIPMELGVYNFCLDSIVYDGFTLTSSVCLEIEVRPENLKTFYLDQDGDGYGAGSPRQFSCPPSDGYVCRDGDCDDNNPDINPATQPPIPNYRCVADGYSVVVSWEENSSFDYELDLRQLESNLNTTIIGLNEIKITGFNTPCQFALLTLRVTADIPFPCNEIEEFIFCRPSPRPEVSFPNGLDNLGTFRECEQHDVQIPTIIINGEANPPTLEWAPPTFDPNGRAPGSYSILFTWTDPIDGCVTQDVFFYTIESCTIVDNDEDGFSVDQDCDDNDPAIFPGNSEVCDGKDNNCNGAVDESLTFTTYFIDLDGDGYGDDSRAFESCSIPSNASEQGNDCDDLNPAIFPGAEEIPNNGIDEDCDGSDATTAVHELAGKTIDVFPNPVSDMLFVESSVPNLSYAIYKMDGSLISSGQLIDSRIVISSLLSGTYLLVLTSKDTHEIVVDRMVKL